MVPIILFVFNRPEKTEQVLAAIQAQTRPPDRLIIFSDGPRYSSDEPGIAAVRRLCGSVTSIDTEIRERASNLGCAVSILDGITSVLNAYDSAVILEDDTLPSLCMYESMCILLERYRKEPKVFSVGGFPHLLAGALPDYPYDVVLSPRFSCWGWGTWADRWHSISGAVRAFSNPFGCAEQVPGLAGADLPGMVVTCEQHPGAYWDIPVTVLALHRQMLHALTRDYLVCNIGWDSGAHGSPRSNEKAFRDAHNRLTMTVPRTFPPVVLDRPICEAVQEYLDQIARVSTAQARRSNDHPAVWRGGRRGESMKGVVRRLLRGCGLEVRRIPPEVQARRGHGWGCDVPAKPKPSEYSTIVGKGSVVPCQIEAYFLALNRYVSEGAEVLDVGFGLGYGLNILAIKASAVSGVDVDPKVYGYCQQTLVGRNPRLRDLLLYKGDRLPFKDEQFDLVTCVDVLEHVERYDAFLTELLRVSRQGVFISTPNRRPEYTNADGTPKNHWHLREWSYEELDDILTRHGHVEWNFLNGPFDGPFASSTEIQQDTLTLSPFVFKGSPRAGDAPLGAVAG
jgi:2-polyprenyl-3-methyl-5-hydroxy-6-metoxy-1,4-benzoquinol methylase